MEYYLLFSTRYLTLKSIHYFVYFPFKFLYSFLPMGWGGMLTRKFWEMNMHQDTICCILRHNFEKCYNVCTDLVAFGWFFRYSYLFTVMITIFLGGKLGISGGGASTPQIPWIEPWVWYYQNMLQLSLQKIRAFVTKLYDTMQTKEVVVLKTMQWMTVISNNARR